MIKFRQLILEQLLSEISTNTSLYHRSLHKMNVGDTIEIPKNPADNQHYLASKMGELAMEQLRKEEAPNAPSRLNCVYSSLIPRSRFVDKGYLYRVKPTGKIFVADSTLIDSIMEKFDREYYDFIGRYDQSERKEFEADFRKNPKMLTQYLPYEAFNYWKGEVPNLSNKAALRDVEVLSDGAVIVDVVNESEKSTPFVIGDNVVVTESNKLRASLTLYLNSDLKSADSELKPNLDDAAVKKLLDYIGSEVFDNVKPEISKYTKNTYEFSGGLKKGAKLKIISLVSNIRGGRNSGNIGPGKYETIMFDFYIGNSLISRDKRKNKENITHRFILSRWSNTDVPNYAKYLKKV